MQMTPRSISSFHQMLGENCGNEPLSGLDKGLEQKSKQIEIKSR